MYSFYLFVHFNMKNNSTTYGLLNTEFMILVSLFYFVLRVDRSLGYDQS